MKVTVWDTYVPRADSQALMHFDILVPEHTGIEAVLEFGRVYLDSKGQRGQPLSAKECRRCHVETAPPHMQAEIGARGYSIIEMEGCDA